MSPENPQKLSSVDKRVIINFRDKNVVIAHYCNKNVAFILFIYIEGVLQKLLK